MSSSLNLPLIAATEPAVIAMVPSTWIQNNASLLTSTVIHASMLSKATVDKTTLICGGVNVSSCDGRFTPAASHPYQPIVSSAMRAGMVEMNAKPDVLQAFANSKNPKNENNSVTTAPPAIKASARVKELFMATLIP